MPKHYEPFLHPSFYATMPSFFIQQDLHPPEELRALCALSDVKIEYVYGKPAKTWRLSVSDKPSITLQTVQFEDWVAAVKILLE